MNRTNSLLLLVSVVLSACAADIGEYEGLDEQPYLSANYLSANYLSANALSANLQASTKMTQVPLATDSYDASSGVPELRLQLHDAITRGFFEYLVSCSLDETQFVEWKDPFNGEKYAWQGSIGFCPDWGQAGGRADDACQEMVSACLLSRVNAFGKMVPFSMRGHDRVDALELAPYVPTTQKYINNADIPAFHVCPGATFGPARECGWQSDRVGRCTPLSLVTVGAGSPPSSNCGAPSLGGSSDNSMLRVCGGLRGCSAFQSLGQADDTCTSKMPAVTFTCPVSGYYSVMYAHNDSTQLVDVAVAADSGDYSLPEYKVFDFREGGFFGNIFDTGALQVNVFVDGNGEVHGRDKTVRGSVYKNMFACWSDTWSNANALFTYRDCAGPTPVNCAAQTVGACRNYSDPSYPQFVCDTDDGDPRAGDRDYQKCKDPFGRVWENAVTPILNRPCDIPEYAPYCGNRKPPRRGAEDQGSADPAGTTGQ